MMINKEQINRIVIKVGTNLLTTEDGNFDSQKINLLAKQIIQILKMKKEVMIVSSGAIGLGKVKMNIKNKINDIELKQASAAVGQSLLITEWNNVFAQENIITAQALLSRSDITNKTTNKNARNALLKLLDLNIVPIINENDVVSTEEIADSVIGDNDNLMTLWASTRQIYSIFEADKVGCKIITVPHEMLNKLDVLGKNLEEYSLDTVNQFYKDAISSNFKI